MTSLNKNQQSISVDTVKEFCTWIGANTPVPQGFRLPDIQRQKALARYWGIAPRPFNLWAAHGNHETKLCQNNWEVL